MKTATQLTVGYLEDETAIRPLRPKLWPPRLYRDVSTHVKAGVTLLE